MILVNGRRHGNPGMVENMEWIPQSIQLMLDHVSALAGGGTLEHPLLGYPRPLHWWLMEEMGCGCPMVNGLS